MACCTVNQSALEELTKVMEWFKTAKVGKNIGGTSKCTDDDRFQRCGPLLEELGLHQEVKYTLLCYSFRTRLTHS